MDIKAYIESGVIESCVLGMADAQEVAELQQLRRQYAEIDEAVKAFELSIQQQAFDNAIIPHASVKEKLLTQLQDEFADTELAKVISIPKEKIATGFSWLKYAAAASVILLIASAGFNIYYYNKYHEVHDNYIALLNDKNSLTTQVDVMQTKLNGMNMGMKVMTDPNMIKVAMKGMPGKEKNLATVFWDGATKDVYLMANNLDKAPTDKQYQLWAIVDGKPVDAGMIDECTGVCKLKNIPKAEMFAITLEKKGGNPTPQGQMYVAGKVI
jgi:hypothetical protein